MIGRELHKVRFGRNRQDNKHMIQRLYRTGGSSQKIFRSGDGNMGANDHRIRVTKLMIRKAFTSLLKQKPIQSISVKELCAAAGISRATFYAHYTDIYDLMGRMEEELMEEVRRGLRKMLEGEPGELSLLKVTAGLFHSLRENADLCTITLGSHGDKEFAARLLHLGKEYFIEAYRRYFPNATPKQLKYYYAFVSNGCMGLLEEWLTDGMTSSADEMAAIAESIMMHGMGFFHQSGR